MFLDMFYIQIFSNFKKFCDYFLIGRQFQRSYSQFGVSNDFNAFIYWLKTYFYQKYIKNECIFVYICVFCESVYGCIFYVFLFLAAV